MKNLVSFGGPNGNDFIWDSLKNVGYVSYNKNSKMTNSLMKEIYQALKNNKPVIVGNANIHWVIVYGYSGDDTINFDVTKFNILDPGTTRRTNLKQFLDEKTSKIQKIIYQDIINLNPLLCRLYGWCYTICYGRNILDPQFKELGVGYFLKEDDIKGYRHYWVQMFRE